MGFQRDTTNFNPHSPCGERLCRPKLALSPCYFNPHSPCGERPIAVSLPNLRPDISIHTPHAGSDRTRKIATRVHINFNPHSPCGERRSLATALNGNCAISIHTPHAGSDSSDSSATPDLRIISIHTPHAGSDYRYSFLSATVSLFQSTLPMRGATF